MSNGLQSDINEKFDIENFIFPCNISIIGPTNSGKTTILKKILSIISDNDFIFIVTNSKASFYSNNYLNYFYLNHVLFLDTDDFKIKLSIFLKDMKEFGHRLKQENIFKGKIIIVFDDVGENLKHSLNNFTQESRHSNITCIFLIHHFTHLSPNIRNSIHYIITTSYNIDCKDFLHIRDNKSVIHINSIIKNLMLKKKYVYCIYNRLDSKFYYYLLKKNESNELNSSISVLKKTYSCIKKSIFQKFLQQNKLSNNNQILQPYSLKNNIFINYKNNKI
jgi:hypothetical protein